MRDIVLFLNSEAKIAKIKGDEFLASGLEQASIQVSDLKRQVSMDTECIERIRNKCYELEAQAEKDKAEIANLQAKIDALMLEYCTNEITQEQLQEWADAQRPADSGTEEKT